MLEFLSHSDYLGKKDVFKILGQTTLLALVLGCSGPSQQRSVQSVSLSEDIGGVLEKQLATSINGTLTDEQVFNEFLRVFSDFDLASIPAGGAFSLESKDSPHNGSYLYKIDPERLKNNQRIMISAGQENLIFTELDISSTPNMKRAEIDIRFKLKQGIDLPILGSTSYKQDNADLEKFQLYYFATWRDWNIRGSRVMYDLITISD